MPPMGTLCMDSMICVWCTVINYLVELAGPLKMAILKNWLAHLSKQATETKNMR